MSLFGFGKKIENGNKDNDSADVSRYAKKSAMQTPIPTNSDTYSEFDDLSNRNGLLGNVYKYDDLNESDQKAAKIKTAAIKKNIESQKEFENESKKEPEIRQKREIKPLRRQHNSFDKKWNFDDLDSMSDDDFKAMLDSLDETKFNSPISNSDKEIDFDDDSAFDEYLKSIKNSSKDQKPIGVRDGKNNSIYDDDFDFNDSKLDDLIIPDNDDFDFSKDLIGDNPFKFDFDKDIKDSPNDELPGLRFDKELPLLKFNENNDKINSDSPSIVDTMHGNVDLNNLIEIPDINEPILKDDILGGIKLDEIDSPKVEPTPKPEAKIVEPKTESKTEEKKEYSTIAALATTRPVEVAYDLKDIYQKEPIEKIDIFSTNDDLVNFVNFHPKTKYLDVSDCELITDYSSIANLKELEELDISGSPALSDLSFLDGLNKLRILNAGNCVIESLANFPTLPSLQVLNLKMNKIKTLEGLEKCTGLHDLVLWGCTNIDNIDIVSNFKELRLLDIDSCNALKEINAIAELKKMVYLNLNYTRIEDLSPIKNLTNLEIFTMDFCPMAISDQNLSYFENLTKLKFLGLRNRLIRSLEYFRNMTEMAELELSGNAIQDLSPLENMTKIQILNLSTNPSLTDLSPLHKMSKLKKLFISGAKTGKTITVAMLIEDISVVKEMPDLEVFESNFNKKIKDISSLQYCKKLEEVYFNDCLGIADVTPLRFCKNLKEMYFENCTQIRNLSFVKYLTKLEKITLAKTSAERLLVSDWTRLYDIKDLKDGDGMLPIHKSITNSVKFRKKISKIAKKTIKDETKNG